MENHHVSRETDYFNGHGFTSYVDKLLGDRAWIFHQAVARFSGKVDAGHLLIFTVGKLAAFALSVPGRYHPHQVVGRLMIAGWCLGTFFHIYIYLFIYWG